MGQPQYKIYLDQDKYIYRYQLKFIKNIIRSDKYFSSADLRELMDKIIVYNFISDIQEVDEDAASLVWYAEEEAVAYSFPLGGDVVSGLSDLGYEIPESDWDE